MGEMGCDIWEKWVRWAKKTNSLKPTNMRRDIIRLKKTRVGGKAVAMYASRQSVGFEAM